MSRKEYSSNAIWEKKVAYRRAVRIGNVIEVSGTTSTIEGKFVGIGDPYLQAKTCFDIIRQAISELGGSEKNIIRTRVFLTNINDWEAVGKAHFEAFNEYPPASTMLEVSNLIAPELLVEVEATAIIA